MDHGLRIRVRVLNHGPDMTCFVVCLGCERPGLHDSDEDPPGSLGKDPPGSLGKDTSGSLGKHPPDSLGKAN